MSVIYSALTPLVVAVMGVVTAWMWLDVAVWPPLVVGGVLLVGGWLVDRVGRHWLLPSHPVAAVWTLSAWALVPFAAAALASGALIVFGIETAPSDDWSTEKKQLTAAAAGAVTAFITAIAIKSTETADESWLAGHVRSAFFASYKDKFPQESEGERWVYGNPYKGTEGWGWGARLKRAAGVSKALAEL